MRAICMLYDKHFRRDTTELRVNGRFDLRILAPTKTGLPLLTRSSQRLHFSHTTVGYKLICISVPIVRGNTINQFINVLLFILLRQYQMTSRSPAERYTLRFHRKFQTR